MNPLEEYPWLFCNGKFWIKDKPINQLIAAALPLKNKIFTVNHDNKLGTSNYGHWRETKNCTLIARPISDMSDEERIGALNALSGNTIANNEILQTYEEIGQAIEYHVGLFLYLLSIGVYPFDQEAFEDGTVLNINEVE